MAKRVKKSAGKRARAQGRSKKGRVFRLIRAKAMTRKERERRRRNRIEWPISHWSDHWIQKYGSGHGVAQLRLFAQCDLPRTHQKSVIRALAGGASFEVAAGRDGRSAFLVSARRAEPGKRWLWDLAARCGADLMRVDDKGRGFEAIAAKGACGEALSWWKERGGGLDRVDLRGRDAWSHAAESGAEALELLIALWGEQEEPIQRAVYGLREAFERRNRESAHGMPKYAKGSAYTILVTGPAMSSIASFMSDRPWLLRASFELSDLLESLEADPPALEGLRRSEAAAMARAERNEILAATPSVERSAAKSL